MYEVNNNIIFKVIGDGELKTEIQNQCIGLPVEFTGRLDISEVAKQMKSADVLFLLSRYEGFGCVIKEAQACGTYVVASDVGGISEAVKGAGSIIDFSNEKAGIKNAADAALNYLNGTANIDVAQILKAAEGFDWKDRQKETVLMYEKVLKICKGDKTL